MIPCIEARRILILYNFNLYLTYVIIFENQVYPLEMQIRAGFENTELDHTWI